MESSKGSPAKPSNLTDACQNCRTQVPYDPTSDVVFCHSCRLEEESVTTQYKHGQLSPPYENEALSTYNAPLTGAGAITNAITSLKRKTPYTPLEDERDAKHAKTTSMTTGRGGLVRQSIGGLGDSIALRHGEDGEESDDEATFVDAAEKIDGNAEGEGEEVDAGHGTTGRLIDEERVVPLQDANNDDEAQEDDGQDDDEDLFGKTFASRTQKDVSEDEDESIIEMSSTTKVKKPALETFTPSEHASGCSQPRGPATPPPTNTRATKPPRPIDPVKDLSRNQNHLRKFHKRALQSVPRIPLASHRYWIGVLNVNEKAHLTLGEKSFTWMRGNRLTTVETIWHVYAQTCVEEGFTLVVAGGEEKPSFEVKMEELDYCGDKKVFFRAVHDDQLKIEEKDWRGVFWGAVPGEGRLMERPNRFGGGKKAVPEVIVLD